MQSTNGQLQSALLACLSHDLRTPLVTVIGSLTAIRDLDGSLSAQDQRKLITAALIEAERLNRLIQNLLDATLLTYGRKPLHLSPVSLAEAIAAAIGRVGAGSRIDARVPTDLPPVCADRILLEQALINVLENATKYSPDGSVVRVIAQQQQSHATVVINDEGAGIAAEIWGRVFDFCFRAQHRTAVPGSGLGLAICKGFIEAMEGSITASGCRETGGTSIEMRFKLFASKAT